MANYLVTGSRNNTPHITSMDDAAFNAGVLGSRVCILNQGDNLRAEVISSNLVRVRNGDLVAQGRHARIDAGDYADLTVANGISDMNRNDLIAARYEKDASTGVESIDFVVIQGSPTSGTPADPDYVSGDIFGGALIAEFPLYRILVRGTSIAGIERIAPIGATMTINSMDVGDTGIEGTNYVRLRVKNKDGRSIDLASSRAGSVGLLNVATDRFMIYADTDNRVNVGQSADDVVVNGTMTAKKDITANGTVSVSGKATLNGGVDTKAVTATSVSASGDVNATGDVTVGSSERTSRSRVRVLNNLNDISLSASTTTRQQAGVYDNNRSKWLISVDKDGKIEIPSFTTGDVRADNLIAVNNEASTGTNEIIAGNAVERISLVANATGRRAGLFSGTHDKYLIRIDGVTGDVELPSAVSSLHVNGTTNLDGTVRIGNITSGDVFASVGSEESHYNAQISARSGAGVAAILSNYNSGKYGLIDITNNKWLIYTGSDNVVHIPSHETSVLTASTITSNGSISAGSGITAGGNVRCGGDIIANASGETLISAGADDNPNSSYIRAKSKNGGYVDIRSSNVYNKAGLYSSAKSRYIIDVPKSGDVTANVENVISDGSLVLGHNNSGTGNNAVSIDQFTDGSTTRHRLRPLSNGAMNLGSSTYRWNNVYAANGTIQTSDREQKKDIESLDAEKTAEFIMGLRPVSYKFKDGTSGRTHYGMIAQEVEQNMTENGMNDTDFAGLCRDDVDGSSVYGLRYDEFIAPLIKVVQEQQKKIDELSAKIEELKK